MNSKYFTLDEMTFSRTAAARGIANVPRSATLDTLLHTMQQADKVREFLGAPMQVSSGYRSPALNRVVGGVANSQHVKGEALDFVAPKFGTPKEVFEAIKKSGLDYDQLILEFGRWVHISFRADGKNRQMALVFKSKGEFA